MSRRAMCDQFTTSLGYFDPGWALLDKRQSGHSLQLVPAIIDEAPREIPMRGSRTPVAGFGSFLREWGFCRRTRSDGAQNRQFVPTVPSWSVVGSVSPTYTENALFSRDNRRRDVFYEPDVSVRLTAACRPISPTASLPEPNTKPSPTRISAMRRSHAWVRG